MSCKGTTKRMLIKLDAARLAAATGCIGTTKRMLIKLRVCKRLY